MLRQRALGGVALRLGLEDVALGRRDVVVRDRHALQQRPDQDVEDPRHQPEAGRDQRVEQPRLHDPARAGPSVDSDRAGHPLRRVHRRRRPARAAGPRRGLEVDRGVDAAGLHGRDRDAGLVAGLLLQHADQPELAPLGGHVAAQQRGRDVAQQRVDDDEVPGPLLPEHRQDDAGDVRRAVHGDVDDLLVDLPGHVLDPAVGHHLGGVDDDVEAAELLDRGVDGGPDRVLVGDVGRADDDGRGAGRPRLGGGLLQRLPAAGDEDQAGAAAGQLDRRRAADAAGGAGDENRLRGRRVGGCGHGAQLLGAGRGGPSPAPASARRPVPATRRPRASCRRHDRSRPAAPAASPARLTGVPAGSRARSPRSAVTTSSERPLGRAAARRSSARASSPLPARPHDPHARPAPATSRACPSTTATTSVQARSPPSGPVSERPGRAGEPRQQPGRGARAVAPPAVRPRSDDVRRVDQQDRHRRPPIRVAPSPGRATARDRLAARPPGIVPADCRGTDAGPTARRRPTMAGNDHTQHDHDAARTPHRAAPRAPRSPAAPRATPSPPSAPLRRHQVGRGVLRLALGQRPRRPPDRAALRGRRRPRARPGRRHRRRGGRAGRDARHRRRHRRPRRPLPRLPRRRLRRRADGPVRRRPPGRRGLAHRPARRPGARRCRRRSSARSTTCCSS